MKLTKIAEALLTVYAHRVERHDRNEQLANAEKSFVLATWSRITKRHRDTIDEACCALYCRCHGMPAVASQVNALRLLAPSLLKWQRCPSCRTWGDGGRHTLDCPTLKQIEQQGSSNG